MELPATRLPEDRLATIEDRARLRGTLGDRVICEMVEEIRTLRTILADAPGPFDA
jgi:hypothetical protein